MNYKKKKNRDRTSEVLEPNWRRPGWPLSETDFVLSSWILRRSASLCFSSLRILTASWAVPTYPSPIPDILVCCVFLSVAVLPFSISRWQPPKNKCHFGHFIGWLCIDFLFMYFVYKSVIHLTAHFITFYKWISMTYNTFKNI